MNLSDAWVVTRTDGLNRVWWGPGRQGLTPDLLHAGIYTHAEARSIVRQSASAKPSTCTHAAVRLAASLGLVKSGTVGALVGLEALAFALPGETG